MQYVPIRAVPSQTIAVTLGGQACRINLYQRRMGLFCDLLVNDQPVIGGVICQAGNVIVRDRYLGFAGDLVFYDEQGDEDPEYTGLGTRWVLAYLEPFQLLA